jgi:hypothetical protein
MSDYALEVIFVGTPNGVKRFVTARNDYRSLEQLAKEVPHYFNNIRGLGEGHYFIERRFEETGISKEKAELGVVCYLSYCEAMAIETLNAGYAPGKNRPKLELVEA